ncbi:recombination mediator RecR [Patescibacteria group bacterium]|nr:recombination mediator RecR [Patescibacteria group bacterium]
MDSVLPKSLQDLIRELSKLPGVGPKSAERLSFYLMKQPQHERSSLSRSLEDLNKGIVFCNTCHNIAENDPCYICQNKARNQLIVCVVEEPWDVLAIESTHEFNGLYHVLHGAISPIDNINPEDLKIKELVQRIETSTPKFDEIIMATNPSLEGEATSMYIAKLLKSHDVSMTRIARGLPIGSDLEYADQMTISKALEGRGKI